MIPARVAAGKSIRNAVLKMKAHLLDFNEEESKIIMKASKI